MRVTRQSVFEAPEGERVFTVVFVYFDPEFPRDDGQPWELARWTSGPVAVNADEALTLEVDTSEYVYEDADGDGLSNLEELRARNCSTNVRSAWDIAIL